MKRIIPGIMAALLGSMAFAAGLKPPPPTEPEIPPALDPNPEPEEVMALCKENPASCGITINDIVADLQYAETEPNDHQLSADPIVSEVPITGQMLSAYDHDWYRFETEQANTIVSVNLAGAGPYWKVSVRDQAGLVIAEWTVPELAPDATESSLTVETGLAQAGGHYIAIQPPDADAGGAASGDTGTSGVAAYSDSLYKLTIVVVDSQGNPPQTTYNFTDVETEFNNLFTTADALGSNVWMQGQFMTGRDIDLYRIDSAGDEVLQIELCPPGTQCWRADPMTESTWALLVLHGEFVGDGMLTRPRTAFRWDSDLGCSAGAASGGTCTEGEPNPGWVTIQSTNAYFLNEQGAFDEALIGIIDPTWGNRNSVVVGLEKGETYFVLVLPILQRTESGDIVHQTELEGPDRLDLILEPFSDDQYTMRVTRTQMTPTSETGFGDALNKLRSTYNTSNMQLDIPEVTVGDNVYTAKLRWDPVDEVFKLESVVPVAEPMALD